MNYGFFVISNDDKNHSASKRIEKRTFFLKSSLFDKNDNSIRNEEYSGYFINIFFSFCFMMHFSLLSFIHCHVQLFVCMYIRVHNLSVSDKHLKKKKYLHAFYLLISPSSRTRTKTRND